MLNLLLLFVCQDFANVSLLNSEEFKIREQAQVQLEAAGYRAVPPAFLGSLFPQSPEQQLRSQRIVWQRFSEVKHWIFPPPSEYMYHSKFGWIRLNPDEEEDD